MSNQFRLSIHIGDYLRETPPACRASWEHHGIYLHALFLTWDSPRCQLPNDDKWLALRFGCSAEDFEKYVKPVLQTYFKNDGNFYRHERLTKENEFSKKQSKLQSDRAKARWPDTKPKVDAGSMPDRCRIDAGSMPDSELKPPSNHPESHSDFYKSINQNEKGQCRGISAAMPDRCRNNAAAMPAPAPAPYHEEKNPPLMSPPGDRPDDATVEPASRVSDHPSPNKPAKAEGKPKRRKTIPEDFSLSPAMLATAERHGIVNGRVHDVFGAFCDHHAAKGTVMLSWEMAWATWCRNDKRFSGGATQHRGSATAKARTVGELAVKVAVAGAADTSEITDYEGGKHHTEFVEKPRVVPLRPVGRPYSAKPGEGGRVERPTQVCEPQGPLGTSPNDVDDHKQTNRSMT